MDEKFPGANTPEAEDLKAPDESMVGQIQLQDKDAQVKAEPHAGQIEDADKAWDMAHSGKDYRDNAAYIRQNVIPKLEQAYDELPEAAQEIREPSEQRIAVKEKLEENEYQQRYEATDETKAERHGLLLERDEIEERVEKLLESKSPIIKDSLGIIFRELLRRGEADKFDEEVQYEHSRLRNRKNAREERVTSLETSAEVLEKWAGVLHDFPLSEAYKERYGLGEVTPIVLARLEQEIIEHEQKIEKFMNEYRFRDEFGEGSNWKYMAGSNRNDSEVRVLAGSLVGWSDTDTKQIASFAFVPGSEEHSEYIRVMEDPESPEETKKAAYLDALDRFIKNSELEFKLKKTFLEDIRTGRASQWQ